ncbi:hypothetical protein [Actinomadura viridis]|uniref:Uncharacterized protein n=1 Tax=Actinomadura viridis TaxID=58110 RepID=A0A931GG96_9ACTN|nr:hypothetical protein [Actinomadura viridis]MBG6086105.1 hypothetical protein [Actinomadura viridis]
MRHEAVRVLRGGALMLGASVLLGGCGLLGGNTDQVCADTGKAFEQYMAQVRGVSAAEPAQWRQPTEQLATRIDGLSRKADDAKLKKALKTEADGLRAAATAIGTGDAARLTGVMAGAPKRIGAACS